MKPFNAFTTEAFATYSPEKWSSNVYNLPRMRVKDNMLGLCERLQQQLANELANLEHGASDDMPNLSNQKKVDAQWIFWFRDAASRGALASFVERVKLDQTALLNIAPQDKHASIAVVLRQNELWIGLHVAAGAKVDRRNIAAKLQKGWERERLLDLFKDLPEGASVGLGDEKQMVTDANLGHLEEQAADLAQNSAAWQLGYSIAAEEVIAAELAIVDQVAEAIKALLPVYRFVTWTRDNDHIEAQKQLQEEKQQKRRQATSFSAGDKVRIMSGLFTGKIGIVQDADTKAQVKVRVGKMSVVVAGSELTLAR
ncbi:MAG: hypothetical protein JW841_04345 [Deltaproteobacteria bacterium]|nr:hypothetical protein [Deltaproteobacteria bacterium]